jgi:twitching motility two-component system response regulator PilG
MKRQLLVAVDDDTDFLEELTELLSAHGYDVVAVSDPLCAVRVIEKRLPDAVLLDLRMDEKDGFEIASELSRNPATTEIPVVVMTGYHDEKQLERLTGSGVVRCCLSKPLVVSDLIANLEKVRGAV